MRPDRYPCSSTEPHGEHQHTDGPDNYYYLCPGQTGKGGGERCTKSTAFGTGELSPTQGEQASGALLARHLPCPVFATMLFDTLHVVRARQITAPEKRAVDDCLTAVRDLFAKLGGRTEDQ